MIAVRRIALMLTLLLLQAPAADIANGKTALVLLDAGTKGRLLFEGREVPLLKHPADPRRQIALIPIGYRTAPGKKSLRRITPSGEKLLPLRVIDGGYPFETLSVEPSKVSPNPAQQKRIKKEYDEAMAIYNRFTPKRYWTAAFALPMHTTVTSAFGTARRYNGTLSGFHSGTDFKAKPGTPVSAVNDGIVVLAKERYYAGNSVIIDHGEGLYSCYYHLSRIDVNVGKNVAKEEKIGLSGSTGRVTGPHLHFAVMLQGVQVDPIQLLDTLNALFEVRSASR